uniref:type II secretion system protein GspD n=1 Tax=Vampirovibrio sp. TaxID=2717857 RepID=UPI00359414C2
AGGGAGGGAAGGAVGMMPSQVRVVADNVQDGAGSTQASQSGGGGGGGQSASLSNSMTLRTHIKAAQMVSLSSTGPIILPDTRLNTLTLMGTADQIAMAEAMIPSLDRKVPQVVLETSLIEINETGQKELGFNFGYNNGGFKLGANNNSSVGINTSTNSPMENLFQWTTSPISRNRNFYYQLNALISQNKAKMLANPTVITSSDNEAVVSIVDEIIRSVTLTQSALTAPTATINIGEAGIVLNLLPKIGANNTVSLRVRPIVSTVSDTKSGLGGIITLLSKREVLTQNVQLQDGETFVLGGLVQNTNKSAVFENPALARLPILGALARNSTLNKTRTELVLLITPHIVKEDAEVARNIPAYDGSGMTPATLSKNNTDRNILPVSFSDHNPPNALPAMQKPHALSGTSHSFDPLENKSMAKSAPRPSGELLPSTAMPATKTMPSNSSDNLIPVSYKPAAPAPETRMTQPAPRRRSSHITVQSPGEPDTSDESIRAIMDKFK